MLKNSIKIHIPDPDDKSPVDVEVNGAKIDNILAYSIVQKEGEYCATVDLKFDVYSKVDISLNEKITNAFKAKGLC